MLKRLLLTLEYIAHAASLFADAPPFVTWLYRQGQWVTALMMQEPIGSVALLCALVVAVALVWIVRKWRPPIS
jgi:hypothetical protein